MTATEQLQHAPLSAYTTFRIGGPARVLISVSPEVDVLAGIWDAHESHPIQIMGGGSNMLISDDGYPGTVVRLAGEARPRVDPEGEVVVSAAYPWDALVDTVISQGFAGMEMTAGIPGTVGGAVVQNAGSHLQCVAQVLTSVRCFDRLEGTEVRFEGPACRFAYRSSIFRELPDRYVLVEATFRLPRTNHCSIENERLRAAFTRRIGESEDGTFPTAAVAQELRMRRAERDHLVTPDSRSAGSFFLNIPLDPADPLRYRLEDRFAERKERLRALPDSGWVSDWNAYSMKERHVYAGSLIGTAADFGTDPMEFRPNRKHGPVRLGRGSSNTIVNLGGACATDVIALARRIRDRVEDVYEVTLQPEVVMVGPTDFTL